MKSIFAFIVLIFKNVFAGAGKTAFDDATFNYDGQALGITDVELGEEAGEIDVSDTESEQGESEYLAGKRSRSISFTGFHKTSQSSLITRITKSFSLVAEAEDGSTTTLSGQCVLLTKTFAGTRDGAFTWAYTGRINQSLSEDHAS